MRINLEHLKEPRLQFGDFFEHEDTQAGLAAHGPFGKSIEGLHKSEIKIGFIGTRETVSLAQEWVTQCGSYIESENIKVLKLKLSKAKADGELFSSIENISDSSGTKYQRNKILNHDFIGFNKDSAFQSCFQQNQRWDRFITSRELEAILTGIENKAERILRLTDLFESHLLSLAQTDPTPDIVIVALTQGIEDLADTVKISSNYFLNFRRVIKARAMQQHISLPTQLLRWDTLLGKGDVQEVATRAWNFCTAQYFKANGIPWRPITLEENTCYIGISFYVAQDVDDKLTMQSSVAQAFDYLGQGLVLRGDPFAWDKQTLGKAPHLTKEGAYKLIKSALKEYKDLKGVPPTRVVIHKTSEFWGKDRGEYDELGGLYEGIDEINPNCETDFVALRQVGLRLFREGNYPPARGTYFSIENSHFLYTMGFIPYLETYPKTYVPEPWQIIQLIGGTSPKVIFREILALSKMNVNNCAYADGSPITTTFAGKVGDIMKHIPQEGKVEAKYKFYM